MRTEGLRVLLTHGSPVSNKDRLAPDTPVERLRELAGMAGADAIICGHSHRPFVCQVDGTHFVNTGSVDRPGDGDPRACYALPQVGPGDAERRLHVQHYRVAYGVGVTVAAIRAQGLPESSAQMLIQGRDLYGVMSLSKALKMPDCSPLPWGGKGICWSVPSPGG